MEPKSSKEIDIIDAKLKKTEDRFNELNKQKQSLVESLNKVEKELVELQGAHRVLTELKEQKKQVTTPKN